MDIIKYHVILSSNNGIAVDAAHLNLRLNHHSVKPLNLYLTEDQIQYLRGYSYIKMAVNKQDFKTEQAPANDVAMLNAIMNNPGADIGSILADKFRKEDEDRAIAEAKANEPVPAVEDSSSNTEVPKKVKAK